ncbi:ARM repeat-containing protein [Terfezia boudieri ATCC MYA-4762]|uniref:ARM repeat-containing protein n=1 Tax=Terfezia boudieri ATCC MYA-4762 TaxID=1051890 RepID=A0A3N4LJ28_9PEZI|nr:ARM repeat-containing protein [Terfezia boudieri ATCC MYA-4762]
MDADSVPLSHGTLLEVLQAASSPSQQLVQSASTQLSKWETTDPRLWSLLQDAYLDQSLPTEVRWIAILTLKNGVDKYWRKSAKNSIPKEIKELIRNRLLSSIDEQSPQLAIQNAVIIGKISRQDYPLDWPDVFPRLTAIIRTCSNDINQENALKLTRVLQILLHVIKEQSSGKLPRTRANLQTITPEMFSVLGNVYVRCVDMWAPTSSPAPELLLISLLCLKVLRRLLVSGFEFPNRHESVGQFWQILQQHLASFLNLTSGTGEYVKGIRKHVIHLGKIFLEMSRLHQLPFFLLPGSIDLVKSYWGLVVAHGETLANTKPIGASGTRRSEKDEQDDGDEEFREKVALHGMLLFWGCVKAVYQPTPTYRYRHNQEKEERATAVELLKSELLNEQILISCMEVLVTKYFMLRKGDLEGWEEDPEAWSMAWEDASESWEFLIRPCAEKLFMDLVAHEKTKLAGPLKQVFDSCSTPQHQDILFKDAVYTAIGLAAAVLQQDVNLDFDAFMTNTLVPEVQISQPWYNILRRRVAILIGQWVTVKISVGSRPTVYKIYQHLLEKSDPQNDLVVRLTAARSLKYAINDWDFNIEGFLPFADDMFEKLLGLMDEVETTETKMAILNVIGKMINRLDEKVEPFAERVVEIIPPLWEATGEEHIFKQAILVVLTKVVNAMREKSVKFHHMVLPLIKFGVESGTGMQVYLLEEGLELWDVTIKNTPTPTPHALLELVPYIFPLAEMGSETLRKVLEITESYIILAPREMIVHYREPLFMVFASLIGDLKSEPNRVVTGAVERVLGAAGNDEEAVQKIVKSMLDSGFLPKLFQGVHGNWEARQTTGPKKKYSKVDGIILTSYFQVLSRIVLGSTRVFVGVVEYIGQRTGEGFEKTMGWLLDEWFHHFGNMGYAKTRKLNLLAFTKLLECNQKWILIRLHELMAVWTDVVTESDNAQESAEDLIYWNEEDAMSIPHLQRLTRLTNDDPVASVDTRQWIKHYLLQSQEANGGGEKFASEWLLNIDTDVLKSFMKLGLV